MHCEVHVTAENKRTLPPFGYLDSILYRPLSRRLDRCDRMIRNESRDPNGGYVYYATMQVTFPIPEFARKERNLHCDVVHLPSFVYLDSFWIMRSQRSRRRDKGIKAKMSPDTQTAAMCVCFQLRRVRHNANYVPYAHMSGDPL